MKGIAQDGSCADCGYWLGYDCGCRADEPQPLLEVTSCLPHLAPDMTVQELKEKFTDLIIL